MCWLTQFNCTEVALRNAIATVGSSLEAVTAFFTHREQALLLATRLRAVEPRSFAVYQGLKRR